jgi:hypothetical protein
MSDTGLKGSILGMWRGDSDPESWLQLIDVAGFVETGSEGAEALRNKMGQYISNIYRVGSYATPLSAEQLSMPALETEE